MLQRFEHLVGADSEHGRAAAAGDVAECVGEEGFADAHRADDGDVGMGIEKAERGELVEERPIEGDLRGRVPVLQAHRRVETRFLHAEGDGEALPPGDFVAEDLEKQILMRHLLLARQREALGQRVEHARQLEPPQDGLQIRVDHIGGRHRDSSPSAAARNGSLYCEAGRR
jgi:hypothetical protein